MTLLNVRKVFSKVRSTGDAFLPAIPAAAVVLAGLVEAMFEDGLFAVGYYLCVLVWALAFILVDLVHSNQSGQDARERDPSGNWGGLVPASAGQ